ncbi:LOW QUALITY PROTEIN: LIF receptor subunit alpha a [Xyrichtys novacula]|uniref:LOW QUALITY PROTEIN: LIF receptor subunit alpha a n=1 Tax=Xyrichtys novacula TaxID=13765 RepID=A0AAV1G518_XYRNO|nr:LOW QUALITY PROTEIN: LIF receptor subunit alpha a [Xyrichtys novacula]
MPHPSGCPSFKSNFNPVWLVCVLLSLSVVHSHAKDVLTVPQQVSLSPNLNTQQLSISWVGGAATTFDLIILRTELNETAFYDTVSVTADQVNGRHQWNWTAVEPLECTSLSVQIRSRDGQAISEWSNTQILQGNDIPSRGTFQMYPQDKIVPVGSNTTFCCVVGEGKVFDYIHYGTSLMQVTRLSRRTYATTVVNQGASDSTGTNVFCRDKEKSKLTGAVVFVGYTPLPTDFVCETRDLTSAVCRWNVGRDTHLYGRRNTRYSLNKRDCTGGSPLQKQKECSVDNWEDNWTLLAVNPLGQYSLSDSAELLHRVFPVAPANVTTAVRAWNATVQWQWKYEGYSSLALACQVELTSQGVKTKRTFSGVGLRSVVLSDLYPDEEYEVQVRCGAQQNFWKWGDWSKQSHFQTLIDVPEAPDVWMWMNKDDTGQIIWKPLTHRQSHGQITGYEVTLWTSEDDVQHTKTSPPDTSAVPINLTQIAAFSNDNKAIATVIAMNSKGASQPASVLIPLHLIDADRPAVSKAVYTDRGFPLSWQNDPNATCGYVVEWTDASCVKNCPVEWTKMSAGNTNVSIESATFKPGVRYNFSLYSCSSEAPKLLQCWHGYMQELVPSSSVSLSTSQQDSNVLLTWGEIPVVNRRGFLLGYNIYISNDSQLILLANLSDVERRSYTVKGLSEGSYKFTVKAYTSAGEDTGATASITMESSDWLILEILASLGGTALLLVIVTFICYKKRKWVKKAFYPDIPEPKLPGDWSRTRGPLDVKPLPHSMVHIVEKPDWDSSKEALVVIPEEDEDEEGQGIGDEPVDTDEPTSLRYYNHVVDERPIRPRFPDSSASSASSLDSARTDVTYTGIQTSGSSLVFQLDPQGSSETQQPHADFSASCGGGGGGYRPQIQSRVQNNVFDSASPEPFLEPQAASSGGYKPQCSWHLDSPEEAGESGGLAPSLGSPTSVASTQFLLPDGEEQTEEKRQLSSSAATWFTNLLSSTKP